MKKMQMRRMPFFCPTATLPPALHPEIANPWFILPHAGSDNRGIAAVHSFSFPAGVEDAATYAENESPLPFNLAIRVSPDESCDASVGDFGVLDTEDRELRESRKFRQPDIGHARAIDAKLNQILEVANGP